MTHQLAADNRLMIFDLRTSPRKVRMKHIKILTLLWVVVSIVFGFSLSVQAQGFCGQPMLSAKLGVMNKSFAFGFEQRCGGVNGGLFGFAGAEYIMPRKSSNGSVQSSVVPSAGINNFGLGGGLGYDFAKVIDVKDLHPFAGLGINFSVFSTSGSGSLTFGGKMPVGIDYFVAEDVALGAEYVFNFLYQTSGSISQSNTYHGILFRINFLI